MKKIGMLLAKGYEEGESLFVVDTLRRAGMEVFIVSVNSTETVKGCHAIEVKADISLNKEVKDFDMIILPGGMPGASNLKDNPEVIKLVQYFMDNNKYVAAICAAPMVLAKANVVKERTLTSYPGEKYKDLFQDSNYIEDEIVVVDDHLITSRGPATTLPFAYKLVEVLGGDAEKLKEGMLYNLVNQDIAAHHGSY